MAGRLDEHIVREHESENSRAAANSRGRAARAASAARVAVAWTLLGGVAHAADMESRAAAQALFDQGRALVAQGNAAEACPKFEESQRLDPGSGTKFHLADCYERTDRIASAWTLFLEVAAESKAQGLSDREAVARTRAAAIANKLSHLAINVPDASRAEGLEILRDGKVLGSAQWNTAMPVDAGEHSIVARAPGRRPFETRVLVPSNAGSSAVTVPALDVLPPEQQPATPAPVGGEAAGGHRGLTTPRIIAYGLGGLGVVGLGVGTFFGIKAISKKSDAEKVCDGTQCHTQAGFDAYGSAQTSGNIATAAFVAGGVLLAAGVVVYFALPPRDAAQDRRAHLRVTLGNGVAFASAGAAF